MISIRSRMLTTLGLLVALAAGCSNEKLPTSYGHRRGVVATKSVNGTAVLSDMFEADGWETASWRRLSPKLREADVILWFPNSFQPPTDAQVGWLQSWLDSGYDRTLVYVGRGYDAAPEYWRRVSARASAEDKAWMEEERRQAEFVWKSDLKELPNPAECDWYEMKSIAKERKVNAFKKGDVWADGVDAKKASVLQTNRLIPPKLLVDADQVEVLLSTKSGEALAYRIENNGSRIIVIANGSFLLNLALVNKENRKLAGKLLADCDVIGAGKAVFVEETPARLKIYDQEPANETPSGFSMLTIWPLGFLLLHLMLLGAVVCFVAFPIFGRARHLKTTGVSDFGKHIQALGALLSATQNRSYALDRLKYYEEHVRRESRES